MQAQLTKRKTWVYWLGLIILALSSLVLFAIVWFNAVLDYYKPPIEFQVPFIVSAIVFVIIGVYMMRSQQQEKISESYIS